MVRHHVSLELIDVHVQCTVEAGRRGQRIHQLGDEAGDVRVGGAVDAERATANVINGLIDQDYTNVEMFQKAVRRQHRVVRLNEEVDTCGAEYTENQTWTSARKP